jgi:hypothetical protein
LLPPCEVDPESGVARPLLESSELPEPFELELPESSELVLESELVGVAVVPDGLDWRAETTATDSPVPPIPRTAVAIAAAPARRIHRLRVDRAEWNASEVTMAVSLAGSASAALQEKIKRPSSSPESSLRAVLRVRRYR